MWTTPSTPRVPGKSFGLVSESTIPSVADMAERCIVGGGWGNTGTHIGTTNFLLSPRESHVVAWYCSMYGFAVTSSLVLGCPWTLTWGRSSGMNVFMFQSMRASRPLPRGNGIYVVGASWTGTPWYLTFFEMGKRVGSTPCGRRLRFPSHTDSRLAKAGEGLSILAVPLGRNLSDHWRRISVGEVEESVLAGIDTVSFDVPSSFFYWCLNASHHIRLHGAV